MSGSISISVIKKSPLPWEKPNIMHVSVQIGLYTHKKPPTQHSSDRRPWKSRLIKGRKRGPESKMRRCHFSYGCRLAATTTEWQRTGLSLSQIRPVYFGPVTQRCSAARAYLPASGGKAEPQRASWHSTCHFQLVPQRESSSTKRKMGLIMEFLFYSALKYRSGRGCTPLYRPNADLASPPVQLT